MKYRVLNISNNIISNPECCEDSKEFPEIVEFVEDECELFIGDENRSFWLASEFFMMTNISEFEHKEK